MNGVISESSPSFENSDDTGCVKRKRNQCERPSSTELVGSGAGVE